MSGIQRPSGRQPAQNVPPSRLSGRNTAPIQTAPPPQVQAPLAPSMPSSSGRMAPQLIRGGAPSARMPAAPQIQPSQSSRSTAAQPTMPSASGRMQAPMQSASGRMQTAPLIVGPTITNAQPNPSIPANPRMSGRIPSQSGRSVSANEIIPAHQPASSQRMDSASSRSTRSSSSQSKSSSKSGVGKKELIIAGSILSVLAVVCTYLYITKMSEKKTVETQKLGMSKALEDNWKKGAEAIAEADIAGRLFILGKEKEFNAEKLINAFKGKPEIYNIIYSKSAKDIKGKDTPEVKTIYEDRQTLYPMNKPEKDDGDVHMSYGFGDAGKTIPLIIVHKTYPKPEGDPVNLGGRITVAVKTTMDMHFDAAKNPKPVEEKK